MPCYPVEEKDDDNDDDDDEEEEEEEEDKQWYIHFLPTIFFYTNRPSFRYKEDQFSLSKTMELQILSIF